MISYWVNFNLLKTQILKRKICIDHVLNFIPMSILQTLVAQDLKRWHPISKLIDFFKNLFDDILSSLIL